MAKSCNLSSVIGLCMILLTIFMTISYTASVSNIQNRIRREANIRVQGLYNASDEVFELTEQTFNKNIYNSKRAWFVEFYNTWCGHCRKYAPTFKAVADYFKDVRDILGIAAIDCSNESNIQTCRYFEIMGYPTLRYFHENYIEAPRNLGLTVMKQNDDISSNIQLVINTIIAEQNEGRAQMIPRLDPFNHTDISKVFELAGSSVRFVFLIIDNDILNGVQSILMFHKVPNIFITYASNSHSALMDSLGLSDNTSTVLILRQGKPVIKKDFEKMSSIKEIIEKFLKDEGIDVEKYMEYNTIKNDDKVRDKDPEITEEQVMIQKVKRMGDVVFQMDLETALRFSLGREVGRTKLIEGEKLNALRNYLKVLVKYFPIGKNGHYFLNDLSSLVINSDSVKGTEISSLLKESEKKGKLIWSSPEEWLGCKGSTLESRGYPCGVWTMFHFLTVNSAEQNVGRKNADPKEVLNAMHGYIKYFFGCADCSQHFLQMAADRKIDKVSSLNDAIMWLWASHNVVNARLAGDATEDPLFPKKQFPTSENCPECRYLNGSWNNYQVENYIKHMYSSINIRYIGSDMKVIHADGTSDSNGLLDPSDSSMFIFVYFGCFLLIIVLMRMFLKRGYRKKPYVHDLFGRV